MTNPDNARTLTDERTVLEAETNLARDEQKLWQRLEQALSDAHERRAEQLSGRLASLEQLPDAPAAELTRAKALVEAGRAVDPVPAQAERAAAVSARRGALQARELAAKALTAALAQVESARAARGRDLDALEGVLQRIEAGAREAESKRLAAREAERQREEAARKEAARLAAEEAARVEKARKAVPVDDPMTTVPGVPAFSPDTAKTSPAMPAMAPATQPAMRAVTAPSPTVSVSPAAGGRKTSRRRRVRHAPPPRKLQVEVAEYGDDTFYTGWNRSISDGGLFVVSLETLPPGHELDVEIHLQGKTIKSRGQVAFNRQDNMANPECQSGAGIKLLNLSKDNASVIESFFAERPPMFFVQP